MTKISNQYSLTNVLFADTTNGRVGVGTTAPVGKFNVVDGTNKSLIFQDSGIADTFEVAAYSVSGGTRNLQINAANLIFGTGTAGGTSSAERMRITSTGAVGIGTSSPTFADGTGIHINNNSGSARLRLTNNTTGGTANDGSEFTVAGSDLYVINNENANMLFITNAAERMRILANGNVLIGNTTDSGDRLRVTGSIASNGSSAGMFFQVRVAGNFLGFYSDNTSTMLVYNTNVGNIATINQSNGSYTALSDVNKKKDFEQSNIGLNEVLQLKPTLYRMKTDDDSSSKHLGFIAQEVKDYIPQAYTESGEGDKKFIGLTEMPLIAALTKAIQQQQTQINELKALINA